MKQTVHFDETPVHFGGMRRWFMCPRCNRRFRVLYGGERFYCRKCYRLQYQSQSEDACDRQLSRARKIRRRLGGMEGVEDPFPPKPKGMHWKTYNRLQAIDESAQDSRNRNSPFSIFLPSPNLSYRKHKKCKSRKSPVPCYRSSSAKNSFSIGG